MTKFTDISVQNLLPHVRLMIFSRGLTNLTIYPPGFFKRKFGQFYGKTPPNCGGGGVQGVKCESKIWSFIKKMFI